MKPHPRTKIALLALPPILGCVAVAQLGSQRPERLIIGKWRTENGSVIEFKADGTFFKRGRPVVGNAEYPCDWLWWGRYSFPNAGTLQTEDEHSESANPSEECGAKTISGDRSAIRFEGDRAILTVNYTDRVWKRIESRVND